MICSGGFRQGIRFRRQKGVAVWRRGLLIVRGRESTPRRKARTHDSGRVHEVKMVVKEGREGRVVEGADDAI